MKLNSDMPRRISIVSVSGLLLFSFMESLILTIIHVFTFFLVFRLPRFGLQIIHLTSNHLTFLMILEVV